MSCAWGMGRAVSTANPLASAASTAPWHPSLTEELAARKQHLTSPRTPTKLRFRKGPGQSAKVRMDSSRIGLARLHRLLQGRGIFQQLLAAALLKIFSLHVLELPSQPLDLVLVV